MQIPAAVAVGLEAAQGVFAELLCKSCCAGCRGPLLCADSAAALLALQMKLVLSGSIVQTAIHKGLWKELHLKVTLLCGGTCTL